MMLCPVRFSRRCRLSIGRLSSCICGRWRHDVFASFSPDFGGGVVCRSADRFPSIAAGVPVKGRAARSRKFKRCDPRVPDARFFQMVDLMHAMCDACGLKMTEDWFKPRTCHVRVYLPTGRKLGKIRLSDHESARWPTDRLWLHVRDPHWMRLFVRWLDECVDRWLSSSTNPRNGIIVPSSPPATDAVAVASQRGGGGGSGRGWWAPPASHGCRARALVPVT